MHACMLRVWGTALIRDLVRARPQPTICYDVCIVGAGAAGIVMAVELARLGKHVCLLEGGGQDVEEDAQEPYQSEIVGLPHNGIHVGRFRASGGSTTRWGGQILELDALDFEHRPWIPGSGWPIEKTELATFYARAIELEGLGKATLADDAVWREIGMETPQFAHFETFFSRWCPETNFARLHAGVLSSSDSIEVWLHANAVGLELEGTSIRGVKVKSFSGEEAVFHARDFVWCIGGIESSRFFLQPDFARMPWQQSGLLGRHFQDHIIASSAKVTPKDRKRFGAAFENVFSRGYKYQPKVRLVREEQQRHGTLNVAALMFFHSDSDRVGAELKSTAKSLLRGRGASGRELARLVRHAPLLARQSWRYAVDKRAYVPPDARMELGVHCEQPPDGASQVHLSSERDKLGMLRTKMDWQVSDLEVRSIRVCTEKAAVALKNIAEVTIDPDLLGEPEAFKSKCGDGYHHMGGMRMARSATDGVVDTNLKLHGIENGYVCSGAVFPCSGFSNPTHTVIALAVRLAQRLAVLRGD